MNEKTIMGDWAWAWFKALKPIPSVAISTPFMDGVRLTSKYFKGDFFRMPKKAGMILVEHGYAVQSSPFKEKQNKEVDNK